MKLTDGEAITWGAMMFLAGQIAERGGGRLAVEAVTKEQARRAREHVAGEFEAFKKKAKAVRREIQ